MSQASECPKDGACTKATDCKDACYKLYTMVASPPARSVLMVMEELGIKYQNISLDFAKGENRTPEFIAVNPNHMVPCLVSPCGSLTLWESGAIIQYLADAYQGARDHWLPTDRTKRAKVIQWLDWRNGSLGPLVRNTVVQKVAPGAWYKDEATRNAVFAENVPALEEKVKILDAELGKSAFVAGAEISVADLSIYAYLTVFPLVGLNTLDQAKYPHVARWAGVIAARPAVVRAHTAYEAWKAARAAANTGAPAAAKKTG